MPIFCKFLGILELGKSFVNVFSVFDPHKNNGLVFFFETNSIVSDSYPEIIFEPPYELNVYLSNFRQIFGD